MKYRLLSIILLSVCAGLFAQNVSLDQAVQTSALAIETRLPRGAKAAVLTFTSASQAFSEYVIDEIATALSESRNLQVIDRQNTDAIRREFNIQFSGDVSDDEVKRVGQQLGAQYIVTGSLVDIGNAYRFRVAAINIETAVREGSSSLNININDPQVVFLLTGQRTTQTSIPEGLLYEIVDGKTVTITGYDGNAVTLNIPEYIQGLPVTTISELVAQWTENSLTSVTIPSSVTSVGAEAFYGCSSLISITVSNGNPYYTSIDGVLFDKTIQTLICYPRSRNQKTFIIPSSVTSIGYYAFYNCSSLTSITIPSSVTYIGYGAFYGCNSLTSITIPSSVTSIGDYTFSGCYRLTSITIPSSITYIGSGAFEHCESLISIAIPSSVTYIGNGAFSSCFNLNSINLPSSVTSIGDGAFSSCTNLTSITIPSSVTFIGDGAFSWCSSLTSITVDSRNSAYASIDGVLFDKNIRTIIRYPSSKTERSYSIPSSVTSIGNYAFSGCERLTSITIPSAVNSIGDAAFTWCSNLTSITIPSSVTSIGNGAFSDCKSLTSITIPSSVASIGDWAFLYCSSLTSITVDSRNSDYASIDGVLFDKNIRTIISYPREKTGNSYAIPSSVTSISSYAFNWCVNLTSITIPSSVITIGDHAFIDCYYLTSITIPSSVITIGDWAFHNCNNLTSVTLSRRTQVGGAVFPETARITYRD